MERSAAYRRAGVAAAHWIVANTRWDDEGRANWSPRPGTGDPPGLSVYEGVPGGVLLLVDAYQATGETIFLDHAAGAGRWLISELPSCADAGLLTGVAGLGFVLAELAAAAPVQGFDYAASKVGSQLAGMADVDDARANWGGHTDVLFGTAGVALYLAHVGESGGEADAGLLAAAGRWLLDQAVPVAPDGLKWSLGPTIAAESGRDIFMPNYSHGTAGIVYALARLSSFLGEPQFLDAAMAGVRYLQSVARTQDGGCSVFHNENQQDVHVLGWCHGPTGLAWMFHGLEAVTGDGSWREWTARCMQTVMESGIPERKFPGFWDNVARCCGSTSVAELAVELYALSGEQRYLDFAVRMTDDILERATTDESGTRWSNVEFRADPPELPAETGYMQGAAGIGCWLLRFARFLEGDRSDRRWPHRPFGPRA